MPLFPCTVFNKNVLPVLVFLTCQISWIKALYRKINEILHTEMKEEPSTKLRIILKRTELNSL